MSDVKFGCSCGTVHGVLHDASPGNSCHLICYCRDCRAFARHMGQIDALEPGGGSALVQVLPSRLDIQGGRDRIACLRLSPKGLHRWYASCCNTPIANTVSTSRVPLAGMWRANFATTDAFGPVVTYGFTKMALPGGPRRDKGLFRMLGGLVKRAMSGYMTGTARRNPFFGPDGKPIVAPSVISPVDRKAAYTE